MARFGRRTLPALQAVGLVLALGSARKVLINQNKDRQPSPSAKWLTILRYSLLRYRGLTAPTDGLIRKKDNKKSVFTATITSANLLFFQVHSRLSVRLPVYRRVHIRWHEAAGTQRYLDLDLLFVMSG